MRTGTVVIVPTVTLRPTLPLLLTWSLCLFSFSFSSFLTPLSMKNISSNNCTSEYEKNVWRRILDNLPNWNLGVTPSGNLAALSCFVHNSVPEIVMQADSTIQPAFISTNSEWAANLVRSNVSIPGDEETLKSLSVCKSTFQKTLPTTATNDTETIHMITHDVKAYIVVDNIARLTKEFREDLKKAEEHWPHSPQESWDKLCLIWDKYGFLWPQRVHIGFKIYKKMDRTGRDDIQDVKNHLLLQSKSQDILHSPEHYSVVWRTELKPVHEFFPNKYSQNKEFIESIIQRFSTLVKNDCLFRLINVKSGDYLGRFDSSTASTSDHPPNGDDKLLTIPSDNNTNTTTSNFCWKFNTSPLQEEQTSPYICKGERRLLYSGQQPIRKELTFASKSYQRNTINPNQAEVKLIQYTPSKPQRTLRDDMKWEWSIGTVNPADGVIDRGIFYLEKAIDNCECLKHGDEITLNQESYYLRTASGYSTYFLSRPGSSKSPMEHLSMRNKSPLSVKSNGDRYRFSPLVNSESNSTQPTSGANSAISSFSSMKHKNRNQSPPINASSVYLERVDSIAQSYQSISQSLFQHHRWRIELVSKSLIDEEERKMAAAMNNLSLNNTQSEDKENPTASYAPYNPKLNLDISRLTSPAESRASPIIYHDILVSSMYISMDDTGHILQQVYQPTPQPQSKWLDVSPQLYNLPKPPVETKESDKRSISSSQYKTPTGSVPSITTLDSPTSSFVPELSEKQMGKQPLQTPKIPLVSSDYKVKRYTQSCTDSEDSWSSSEPPSSPVDKNDNVDLNIVGPPAVSSLSEAEAFKRNIQQSYSAKDRETNELGKAHAAILHNLFAPSPKSNSTSQIRYYDEDDDEFFDHGGSSQVRTYTVTPRSKYSQLTPASYANLSPEEYLNYRRCRENSFMLLVDRETKQQFWLNAIKQSSLGHLLNVFSPAVKKFKKSKQQNTFSSTRSIGSNANLHQSNNGHRIIQKKKGFYNKKNRKAEGIVI